MTGRGPVTRTLGTTIVGAPVLREPTDLAELASFGDAKPRELFARGWGLPGYSPESVQGSLSITSLRVDVRVFTLV